MAVTDGSSASSGSKYTSPTGPGWLGTNKVATDGSLCVTKGALNETAIEAGDRLFVVVTDEGRALAVLLEDPAEAQVVAEYTASPYYGGCQFRVSDPVLDEIGVGTGDLVRIYRREDGVDLVPAETDPRVRADGGVIDVGRGILIELDGEWHHSVNFDGDGHVTSCGKRSESPPWTTELPPADPDGPRCDDCFPTGEADGGAVDQEGDDG